MLIGYMASGTESTYGKVTDWQGNPIGHYRITGKRERKPGTPGAWISRYVYSLVVKLDNGEYFKGQSAGGNMAITGRPTKDWQAFARA